MLSEPCAVAAAPCGAWLSFVCAADGAGIAYAAITRVTGGGSWNLGGYDCQPPGSQLSCANRVAETDVSSNLNNTHALLVGVHDSIAYDPSGKAGWADVWFHPVTFTVAAFALQF